MYSVRANSSNASFMPLQCASSLPYPALTSSASFTCDGVSIFILVKTKPSAKLLFAILIPRLTLHDPFGRGSQENFDNLV